MRTVNGMRSHDEYYLITREELLKLRNQREDHLGQWEQMSWQDLDTVCETILSRPHTEVNEI